MMYAHTPLSSPYPTPLPPSIPPNLGPCSVVPVGKASVMIAASSKHRREAIEAVAHAIEAVKSTATIWKKV